MLNIKSKLVELRDLIRRNSTPELVEQKKSLKKEFRRVQRQNIYFNQVREQNNIQSSFNLKNKNKFWSYIRRSKKKRIVEKNVSIKLDLLHSHFKKLFSNSEEVFSQQQISIKNQISSLLSSYSRPDSIPFLDMLTMEKILDKLDYSLVCGLEKLSYSLLKHDHSKNNSNLNNKSVEKKKKEKLQN
ncbi:hypothetical protein BpHYR1_045708 [Brachionus plicatilis]|uniref:Uncharacterized protein n=1 Tax=Brachionus plicatilis TaxID=10195 RepID=A0A3M7PRP2_BRAPC|nr:hypothetical protein BpHYR1_045708 [Brachionus plicatilis]